ncbi:armadillo repeat-containing protein 3 [Cylas formicarius]|uniref:armadillo repeat-containing protein 3 n=1 Tax=Cylas formicarius TaxID=197179 RepID=UPI00295862E7|nr:armadillo repeat-containing protein 3 [Cylas formicarius]
MSGLDEKFRLGKSTEKGQTIIINEKTYNTKQVETSIAILASPEPDVVLEALLFLSKYADISTENAKFLISNGLIQRLVQCDANICILRVSLRLLSVLLDLEEATHEIHQEKYDQTLRRILDMYVHPKDAHITQFCANILSKVVWSQRIKTLVDDSGLLAAIFANLKISGNDLLVHHTLKLLLNIAQTSNELASWEFPMWHLNAVVAHLNNNDSGTVNLAFDIIEELTNKNIPVIQEAFKSLQLVENMLKIIMNEERQEYHSKALLILHNCLKADETCWYFLESIEFLELCQWAKTCALTYLLALIEVFVVLTAIPEIKQMLFDLSVEESILYFFRSNEKEVLNKTCQAVSNMTSHKYCCQKMLTPVVAKILVDFLDQEDPLKEIALKTILNFIRRYVKALDIFVSAGFLKFFMKCIHQQHDSVSEEKLLIILEITYRCVAHPVYQSEIASNELFIRIFKWFVTHTIEVSKLCCELASLLISLEIFRQFFVTAKMSRTLLESLRSCENEDLLTMILNFMFCGLTYEEIASDLLRNGIVMSIKSLPQHTIEKSSLIKTVLHLTYNCCLQMKFFETNRLEVFEKIDNKFYVINGEWYGPFPFLEVLEVMKVSPRPTIYLVDFSCELAKEEIVDTPTPKRTKIIRRSSRSSDSLTNFKKESTSTPKKMSSRSSIVSGESLIYFPTAFQINFGKISPDPFLSLYIRHIKKYEQFLSGRMKERIKHLAEYVNTLLCGQTENLNLAQKIHEYKLHLQFLKNKIGNNVIPIGYLRVGFHCERALLFKTLADQISIPSCLVKGTGRIYWNEVAIVESIGIDEILKFYVVDLMENIGQLTLVGSREANRYCRTN